MSTEIKKKIFISHAAVDAPIGEKFLDALVELGIDKNEVFYTSHYHTGVKLGHDFHYAVREALKECDIVVFLLTRNFYRSEYCLYEMGAVWITEKSFIPILLDSLTYEDMKGFIDSHYIAYKPSKNDSYKLLTELNTYIKYPKLIDIQNVFDDFVVAANEMAIKTTKMLPVEQVELSEIDKMIINNRFTDGELLLLDYFVKLGSTILDDTAGYDAQSQTEMESEDLTDLKAYANKYSFDYAKARFLLSKSGYGKFHNSYEDDFDGFELDIGVFRDLLSLSFQAKSIIETVKAKYESAVVKANQITSVSSQRGEIDEIVLSPKFKEIEALLFQYIVDTTTLTLGDRWMASLQKESIKRWEDARSLNNKLSTNYDSALRGIIHKKLVEVASLTSYGNPREYRLKEDYFEQMTNLSPEAQAVINAVLLRNAYVPPELPF